MRREGEISNTNDVIPDQHSSTSERDLSAIFEALQEWEKTLSESDLDFEELGL